MKINTYSSKQEVAKSFSKVLCSLINENDETRIALSGGSTPKIVFDYLATHFKDQIAWNKVYFYWGDERCVPPESSESNYKMTVDHLLSKINIPGQNIYRIKGENTPDEEAIAYGKTLASALPEEQGYPQFDLVILGMGDDGHTASIFPHEIDLWHSDEYCEVATHPESGQKRISITGAIINAADTVAFLVTGSNKAEKVKEIIHKEGNFKNYPATLVEPLSERLLWFMDEDAALLLNQD